MARRLNPEDLYAIELAEDPDLSPEGATVAYVVCGIDRPSYEYRRSIWVVPSGGGGGARQYTGGPNDTTPRWSPDGRWLAFRRAPAGELKPKNEEERNRGLGEPQIWLLPVDGGEARQLTFARYGAGEPVWSGDSSAIFYTTQVGDPDDQEAADARLHEKRVPSVRTIDRLWYREDGRGWTYETRSHIFRIGVPGGEPVQLTDGDWDEGTPAISPDGRSIAFTSGRAPDRWTWQSSEVWLLDLESRALRRLSDETLYCYGPAWSPDGRALAFVAGKRRKSDGHADLFVAAASGEGGVRRLTADFLPTCEDSCIDDQRAGHGGHPPLWSHDGKDLFFLASGRGTTQVYAIPAEGGTARPVTRGDRRIYGVSADRQRRLLALASSNPLTPGDIYLQPVEQPDAERRLTALNAELFRDIDLVTPHEFGFKGPDGWDLQGWILKPSQAKQGPVPAILEIHGGPMAMYGWSFFFEFQLLAANGYAVVYGNPRGSTGYGRQFSGAVNEDWGGKDYQDIMAGLDAAVASGGIDPDRLGVAGGSYGGYMTNWVVGHTDRFKAAITMRCVSNFATHFGTSDFGWYLTVDEMGDAVPWKDLDRLMERSPITYVERIQTPLLILHSDNDLRCPISEAEQMFAALKYLGREVKLIRFEGQAHDLSRNGHPRSRVIRLHHILDWFASHIPATGEGPAFQAELVAATEHGQR